MTVRLDPDSTLEVPVHVTAGPEVKLLGPSTPITFIAVDPKTGERNAVVDHLFGP